MANGYFPYILRDITTIAGAANPTYKIDKHGLLEFLNITSNVNPIIPIGTPEGHKRTVKVRGRQPFTDAQVDTSKSCDNVLTPVRKEWDVALSSTRQIGFYLTDEQLALYEVEASQNKPLGASQGVSAELVDAIYAGANAILKSVNKSLWSLVTPGVNRVSGLSTATTLNLPKDTGVQPLTQGMPKLLSDLAVNGFAGRPALVGGPGLMFNYLLTQPYKGLDQGGFNSGIATAGFDYFMDQATNSVISANQFYAFEPGSIHLVEYMEYTGFKAGPKPGGSEFFVLPIPVTASNGMQGTVKFDCQLKYIDCPTTLVDAYSGQSATYEKGWAFLMSKQYGLWQIQPDAYRMEDERELMNGALLYTASNDCDTCD